MRHAKYAACNCTDEPCYIKEEKYRHLPKFYAYHKVRLSVRFPTNRAKEMNRVRGEGTFETAIGMIRELNELGYGKENDLVLNMVYNPAGAFFLLCKVPWRKSTSPDCGRIMK